jgi:hypothetical protein
VTVEIKVDVQILYAVQFFLQVLSIILHALIMGLQDAAKRRHQTGHFYGE